MWCLCGGVVLSGVALVRGFSWLRGCWSERTVRTRSDDGLTIRAMFRGVETALAVCTVVVLGWLVTAILQVVAGGGTLLVAVVVVFGAVAGTLVAVAVSLRVAAETIILNA